MKLIMKIIHKSETNMKQSTSKSNSVYSNNICRKAQENEI